MDANPLGYRRPARILGGGRAAPRRLDAGAKAGGRTASGRWLWDLAGGKEPVEIKHDRSPRSLAFAPDGKTLASGGRYGTVRLWDVSA